MAVKKIKNKWRVMARTPGGRLVKRLFDDKWSANDFEKLVTTQGLPEPENQGISKGITYRDFVTDVWLPAARSGATTNTRVRKPQQATTNYHVGKRLVRVLELIGNVPLADLSMVHYERVFDALESVPMNRRTPKKYAPSTANKMLKHMGESLKFAVRKKLIPFNPWADGERFYCPPTVKDHWKPEQCKRFLDVVAGEHPGHYAFFVTVLSTGMRRGEMFGLQFGDLDFTELTITVSRQFDEHHYNTTGESKTKPGLKNGSPFKVIPMSTLVSNVLKIYTRNIIGKETVLFDFGMAVTKNPTRLINLYRVRAGVPRITFHRCRDSFISNMSRAGVPEALIAQIAGCTKSNLATYQRFDSTDTRRVINAVTFE